jgi:hypothetical protein
VLAEEALNAFVECTSGFVSGNRLSITLKLGLKRSIEHFQFSRLLGQHGVDYVRGYVDALKEVSLPSAQSSQQFEEGRSNARPRNEGCT